ncbi:MAG TPA: hypothetical protein VHK88_20230 [Aquihabitans sp.]|jgi:hypothetical protein|nr:hypothetical protein [Aquihabitans sp.]
MPDRDRRAWRRLVTAQLRDTDTSHLSHLDADTIDHTASLFDEDDDTRSLGDTGRTAAHRPKARLARAAALVCAILVLAAVVGSQVLAYAALDAEKGSRERSEEQVEALRTSRDEWERAARQANAEKVSINCQQIGRLNDFITVVAQIAATGERTPEEREALAPFLTPPPRPAECPPEDGG